MGMQKLKVILFASLILASSSARASTIDEACKAMAKYAEETMKARQHGIPLQTILDLAAKQEMKTVQEGMKEIAIEAWSQSRFFGEEMQERAIGEFRDHVQVKCLQLQYPMQ